MAGGVLGASAVAAAPTVVTGPFSISEGPVDGEPEGDCGGASCGPGGQPRAGTFTLCILVATIAAARRRPRAQA